MNFHRKKLQMQDIIHVWFLVSWFCLHIFRQVILRVASYCLLSMFFGIKYALDCIMNHFEMLAIFITSFSFKVFMLSWFTSQNNAWQSTMEKIDPTLWMYTLKSRLLVHFCLTPLKYFIPHLFCIKTAICTIWRGVQINDWYPPWLFFNSTQ